MIRRIRDFIRHRHDWTWHSGMEAADDTGLTCRRVEPEHRVDCKIQP